MLNINKTDLLCRNSTSEQLQTPKTKDLFLEQLNLGNITICPQHVKAKDHLTSPSFGAPE